MDVQKVEFSYDELLEQNKALSEELAQCQKDKDFVWNLWKNLQEEKPDLASVISSVVEREQMKSDAKDLKVLNILQQKDQQIKTLEEIAADLQVQLKQSSERLAEMMIDENNWQNQVTNIERDKEHLESQLQRKEEELSEKWNELETLSSQLRGFENEKKQNRIAENIQQDRIDDLEERLQVYEKEADDMKRKYEIEIKTFQEVNASLEKNVDELKVELSQKIKEFDEIQENLEIREEEVKNYLEAIEERNERLEQQELDINSLRKQLQENAKMSKHISEQSELIKNLEELQDETQKVLHKQQETHQQEIRFYQKSISDLTKKARSSQKACEKLMNDNKKLGETIIQKDKLLEKSNSIIAELKSQELPVEKFCQRCSELQNEIERYRLSMKQSISNKEEGLEANLTDTINQEMRNKQEIVDRLQDLVNSMEIELHTTRTANKQRLDRYKYLQENHNLVLQQLATYEKDSSVSLKKNDKIKRSSHKSLRHEESESVWNELEYYKKEYQKYKKERPRLLEDLDELKVKLANDSTLINNLKLKLADARHAISDKEKEIEDSQQSAVSAKTIALERQIEIWKEKLDSKHNDLEKMEQKYMNILQNEHAHQQEVVRLTTRILELENLLNRPTKDCGVQTDTQDPLESNQLLDKMNQVLEHVTQQGNNERLTVSQLESTLIGSVNKPHNSPTKKEVISTQTTPRKIQFDSNTQIIDQSTQTEVSDVTSTEETENTDFNPHTEKAKRKQRLKSETQKLLLMRSDLSHENRSLKKRVLSLETQLAQLKESRNAITKEFGVIESEKEKLKSELVSTLHKLQATREILQERSQELERCTEELEALLQKERDQKQASIDQTKEIKSLNVKIKELTTSNSQSVVKLASLESENTSLTQKLKQTQEKVLKLEKTVNQKKTYVDELKDKYNELKNKVDMDVDIKETLEKKLKITQDREQKNKIFVEQLKKKNEHLSREKVTLNDQLTSVQAELHKKSRLLEESQRLCRNAESAISEMEQTAYEQLKSQHEGMSGKHQVIKTRYDKTVGKLNELKVSVVNFAESLLSEIHDNHSRLIAKKRESAARKQDSLLGGDAFQLACSILNMTTEDLEDFLRDEEIVAGEGITTFEENSIRQKLDLILQKEKNFGKVLTRFLVDLVKFNGKIHQEVMTST